MRYLVDTNILLRWSAPSDADHPTIHAAVRTLRLRGDEFLVSTQNLVEFWNAATRPSARNGFGLTPNQAAIEIARLEQLFPIAPDDPRVYPEWRMLVTTIGVSGVQVHDARLAAIMRVHGIGHILTLNPSDFRRYPGISPIHPRDV